MENNKITAMITLTLFFIGVAIVSAFSTSFAFGANNTFGYFNVTVTVTGGAAPNITGITIVSATPVIGGTTTAYALMNVTDAQGYDTVDASNTYVEISLNGVTITGTTGCANYTAWDTATQRGLNCTIDLEYYREPGQWNLSGYTQDIDANTDDEINGSTLIYGQAIGMNLESNLLNFTGTSGSTLSDTIVLNNTGNVQFNNVNVTATGLSDGSNTIGPGNFTVNTVDALGAALSTGPTSASTVLPYGAGVTGTEELWFHLVVPNVPTGQYNSTGQWEIEVYN